MANLLFATRESDSLRSENPRMSQPSRGLVLGTQIGLSPNSQVVHAKMWGDGLWGWSGARLKGWGASAAINGPPPAWRSLPPRDGAHSSGRWQRSARQQQS